MPYKPFFTMRDIDRRDFLKFCGATAAAIGLSDAWVPKIAEALESAAKRQPVIWLHFASDTGCTESVIKSVDPSIAALVLDVLSIDYHETIMAAAGAQAEEALDMAVKAGGYLCIVEGGIPTKADGKYLTVGSKTALQIAKEVTSKAVATIAIGSCATWGGVPAANPNPSQIKGVKEALGIDVVNLDGCPVNPEWVTSTIVHYLLLGKLPELDRHGRPLFLYGTRLHDKCPRRANFDAGNFVESYSDPSVGLGYCLYKVGCKGPMTFCNCPNDRWNDRVSWCIEAGQCIGCTEPNWPDQFAQFYRQIPNIEIPGGGGVEKTANKIGVAVGVATAAGIAGHAAYSIATGKFKKDGSDKPEEGK